MESIPEHSELTPATTSTNTTRLKEIYNSEKVDTRVRTIPEAYLRTDSTSGQAVCDDKAMAENGVMDPYESQSTAYTYSYESAFDDNNEQIRPDEPQLSPNDTTTETTKVTRVTKMTTTRSVKHMPVASPHDVVEGYYFDEQGPIVNLQNGKGTLYTSEHHNIEEAHSSSSIDEGIQVSQRLAHISLVDCPQVIDVDSTRVTLVWPPVRGSIGYHVEYKHPTDRQWHPAHVGVIEQPNCTLTNLEPNASLQFRVSPELPDGTVGPPSASTNTVQLHPPTTNRQSILPTRLPPAPSTPCVTSITAHNAGHMIVRLDWQAPLDTVNQSPIAGYIVQYRVEGSGEWIHANDYLITECQFEVMGLRPNGIYEFRVISRNSDGQSSPSLSSQPTVITPMNINHNRGGTLPYSNGVKGALSNAPEIVSIEVDGVTLEWTPPVDREYNILGYIVESRQIGDTNWYTVDDRLIRDCHVIVAGLQPDGSYEFRVICKHTTGVSPPSDISQVVQLTRAGGVTRKVPKQPDVPQIMDMLANQVTLCWPPTQSTAPVHGYDVEFVDIDDVPQTWCKVNEILMSACKMTISDLTYGHRYGFRVIAKNAIGYSQPSDISEVVTITPPNGTLPQTRRLRKEMSGILALQDELVRESPPLPDRDDSPPPIHKHMNNNENLSWRDPTLPEVLEYLSSPNNVIRLNAAGFLQHLTYNDNEVKKTVREMGGIEKLIDLMNSDIPEIQKNACGCLRNMCYGRENDENKIRIQQSGGVQALVQLLRKTPDMQVKAELTGTLWNMSSCDQLKRTILECCSEVLVKSVILPGSGIVNNHHGGDRSYNPDVFKNATGILRNVSAATDSARKLLRDMPQFIDALVFFLNGAVLGRDDYESRNVENCICVLRNLSYRSQEIDDPNYDQQMTKSTGDLKMDKLNRSKSAPSGSPKLKSVKLFKKSKTNSPSQSPYLQRPARGVCLLWSEEVVKIYAALLKNSSNGATLEASAGAIQNLAACHWEPSEHVRTLVRQEKILPLFVELSRVGDDRVVGAVTTAMRNLALDAKNRDLIGSYAMKELVAKLPPPHIPRPTDVSDLTLCSVLALLYEITKSSGEFTRSLHECGGTSCLMYMCKSPNNKQYSQRVVRYAAHVLSTMWSHKDAHSALKQTGLNETDYVVPLRLYGGQHATTTLARPISTQGPERPKGQSRIRPDINDSLNQTAAYGTLTTGRAGSQYNDDSPRSQPYSSEPGEPLYAAVQKSHDYSNQNNNNVYDVYDNSKEPEGDSWV